MKTRAAFFLALPSFFMAGTYAGPRTSASYSITADTADVGGKRATSASYTNDASASAVAGLSNVAAPSETVKGGYVGQLYDVTGLVLNASALTVNETATLQLAAWQFLDDTSLLAVGASSVAWGVVSGPIAGISISGLATAGTVPQNTAATVQGSFGGFTGLLNLTVLDAIADNFGSYASDGLPDDWQVQYFGLNNPLAAPTADPSGNGQNNRFKYYAGLDPLDPHARFTLKAAKVAGQKSLTFSPRFTDRTYTVVYRSDLASGTWLPLAGTTESDNGTERTVTLPGGTGPRSFYHIEITKP